MVHDPVTRAASRGPRRWGRALARAGGLLALLAGAGPSCAGPGGDKAIAAAVSAVVIGATASAVSRAYGGCYAACTAGTVCNEATGLCERLPCDGRCRDDEACEESGTTIRCVPKAWKRGDLAAQARSWARTSTTPIQVYPGPIPDRRPGDP